MSISRRRLLEGGAAALVCTALPMRSLGLLFPDSAFAAPAAAGGAAVAGGAAGLRLTTFAALVGTRFGATVAGSHVDLRLARATKGQKVTRRGENFSLLFDGAGGAPFGQGTYTFTHPSIGSFPMFVVPVNQANAAPTYEAVFNRV